MPPMDVRCTTMNGHITDIDDLTTGDEGARHPPATGGRQTDAVGSMVGPIISIMRFRAGVADHRQANSMARSRNSTDVYQSDVFRNVPKPKIAWRLDPSPREFPKEVA
jgi:hypothetical protein